MNSTMAGNQKGSSHHAGKTLALISKITLTMIR